MLPVSGKPLDRVHGLAASGMILALTPPESQPCGEARFGGSLCLGSDLDQLRVGGNGDLHLRIPASNS